MDDPVTAPLVIELAGLAGAGKSALARALTQRDPTIRARPHISAWRYLTSVPALAPTFFDLHWPFHGMLTKEMKRMLRVRALYGFAQHTRGEGPVVFDEGPVYMLARMLVFGEAATRTRAFERWWQAAITQWRSKLDAVVWLEAPDAVLASRIRTRSQQHPLQGHYDATFTTFFRAYRDAFERVLDLLCVPAGPPLWTFETEQGSADERARMLLARLPDLRRSPASVRESA
jgi:hypothetical protein